MHTPFLRLNVTFFTAVTVLAVVALGCAAQYFIAPPSFDCKLTPPQISRFRQFYRPAPQWEHAQGSFRLDADLRPLWNWNTGQLFVYVTVSWETPQGNHTQVIWDRIIREQNLSHIQQEFDLEYTINDQYASLRGRKLEVNLFYDIMPVVGALKTVAAPQCSGTFQMPSQYRM